MSTEIWLDPEKTAPMKPFEWDDPQQRNGAGISPFAVPDGLECFGPKQGLIHLIKFSYPNEESPLNQESLDKQEGPAVLLTISRGSWKILEMQISPATGKAGLGQIAERMIVRSSAIKPRAKSFSYRMVAAILEKFPEAITGEEMPPEN